MKALGKLFKVKEFLAKQGYENYESTRIWGKTELEFMLMAC